MERKRGGVTQCTVKEDDGNGTTVVRAYGDWFGGSDLALLTGSDISQGIILILTLAGKNPIRKMCKPPVGAGAAVNIKKVLEPINLALIEVHVARVGPMKAMVNTRAISPYQYPTPTFSTYKRRIVSDQIKSMLSKGIIEPSSSPWSANVVLIKKKDGNLRFCVDNRPINQVTKKDVYPMPRPDDLIQRVVGAAIFSSMDIKSAFWKVPVHPEDKEKTAFTHCLAYIDDVLIFGANFREHEERLEVVLAAFLKAKITLNVDKCNFCVSHVKFLGHLVDGEAPWEWKEEHQRAMRKIQDALLAAPVLAHDDDDGELVLKTDANKNGLGAVLNQLKRKIERPIIFISRRTSKAEMNYHSNGLECLALVLVLNKLKSYVYGRSFTVYTDNSALKWLFSKKDIDGKYARWILALQEFQIEIKHIKRHLNVVADALSRFPVIEPEETDLPEAMCCSFAGSFHPPEEIALLQQNDKATRIIRMQLRENKEKGDSSDEAFVLRKDVLYRKNPLRGRKYLLVVPSLLRREVLSACHNELSNLSVQQTDFEHQGREVNVHTHARVAIPHSWHGLHWTVYRTYRGKMHALVIMDYLSKWIITVPCPDVKTKGVIEILNQTVIPQHGFMKKIITDQGTAFSSETFAQEMKKSGIQHILATCERPQTNGLVERASRTLVSAIRSFVNLSHNDWDLHIPMVTLAINSARQSTSRYSPFELVYGRTPILCQENKFPWPPKHQERVQQFFHGVIKWRSEAKELFLQSQSRSQNLYDLHKKKARHYVQGDLVLVRRIIKKKGRTKKFLSKFIGPFEIVKKYALILT
ncbi:Uncharacterized protein APZ42_017761 [Daphnia magna]|uniref:Integrase catalytic domain-containing protein n=1 Tax=Daphnia magna TaxID=35525 RepID=A0A164ZLK0_9CRUS|nr:Uncharacterized protein APZ42_017761 [Daphnia magna]